MPIYAYKCASCGFAQDEMQKISDAPLSVCPSCGKADYAKQLTAAGFALKGSGWYATDFKDNGKPATPAAESKTEAAPSHACGTGACPACN
ncbi:MAG: FmdB family zinc ribbon protein [Thiobacillus sp.]